MNPEAQNSPSLSVPEPAPRSLEHALKSAADVVTWREQWPRSRWSDRETDLVLLADEVKRLREENEKLLKDAYDNCGFDTRLQ
jgi:hypothetical protein